MRIETRSDMNQVTFCDGKGHGWWFPLNRAIGGSLPVRRPLRRVIRSASIPAMRMHHHIQVRRDDDGVVEDDPGARLHHEDSLNPSVRLPLLAATRAAS